MKNKKIIHLIKFKTSFMKNQFFLLLSFFTSYCYSQTVPENLQADGYERHTEIRWDKLPTSHTVEIHRSEFNTNNQ